MSLQEVKRNLLNSYIACGNLQTQIRQINLSFGRINENNYSSLLGSSKGVQIAAKDAMKKFEKMGSLNKKELSIFFDVFNKKTDVLISKVEKLDSEMEGLQGEVRRIQRWQAELQRLPFIVKIRIWVNQQTKMVSLIRDLIKELDVFKQDIDTCNYKTKLGVANVS